MPFSSPSSVRVVSVVVLYSSGHCGVLSTLYDTVSSVGFVHDNTMFVFPGTRLKSPGAVGGMVSMLQNIMKSWEEFILKLVIVKKQQSHR